MLTGLGLEAVRDGRTIEIVTDPMQFKRTMEYQALTNVQSPVPNTFLGKDFLQLMLITVVQFPWIFLLGLILANI